MPDSPLAFTDHVTAEKVPTGVLIRVLTKVLTGVLCISAVLLTGGCNSSAISVTITPDVAADRSQPPLVVAFTRAYYAPSQSGEDQIVLVGDPIDESARVSPGAPLPPAHSPPIRYVMLIDLRWRNAVRGNVDSPVASNAALHWYVLGKPDTTTTGVLHYLGQGSVWLSRGDADASINVQSGEMLLSDQHGNLRNPFTRFYMKTNFRALADSDRVRKVMDEVRSAIAEADKTGHATTAPATIPTTNPTLMLPAFLPTTPVTTLPTTRD